MQQHYYELYHILIKVLVAMCISKSVLLEDRDLNVNIKVTEIKYCFTSIRTFF
jgi:hypothetical protein